MWKITNQTPIESFLNRNGLDTKEKREKYFGFTKDKLRRDYKDMDKVAGRIAEAIRNNENITIAGDYDCDGINATVILLRSLKRLGMKANYIINDRFTEGYGLNLKSIKRLIETYPETDLIITCDNGISAQEGIKYALEQDIDVVCTDHHRQTGEIVVPTIDEWRNDENPELREESCGAEIARRTIMNVFDLLNVEDEEFLDSLITFSGIATIADVVYFTPANHYIAKRGLELLREPKFPVIKLMLQVIGADNIDEETVGFQIAPLFNALSRVKGSVEPMVNVLLSDKSTLDTYDLLNYLVMINEERKLMTQENIERAMQVFNPEHKCIILAGQFDSGIAGLVCSKFVETYNKPCICLSLKDGIYKGSARSYLDFDLKSALDECADLLLGYGGHAGAAGLSLKEENLNTFISKMGELVDESKVLEKDPVMIIDYVASVDDMYDETIEQLMELAPFGPGFEKPNIIYNGKLGKVQFIPRNGEKKHVSFEIKGNLNTIKCYWWNSIDRWSERNYQSGQEISLIGNPKIEVFNGKPVFKVIVNEIQ